MTKITEEEFGKLYSSDTDENKVLDTKPTKKAPTITLYSKVVENPVSEIRKLISITENQMQERQMVWNRYRRKYRRGMYYLRTLSNGTPLYFTNYLFAAIETTKANLVRNLPRTTCSPVGERDDFAADMMSRVLTDSLRRGGFKRATRAVVHHGLIATMAYYKVSYSYLTDGLVIDALAPDDLLVDPKAETLNDARWAIHKRKNVPTDEIYAEFDVLPKFDADATSGQSTTQSMNSQDSLYITTGELSEAINVAPTFDVYECWVRCWEEGRENDWYIVTIAGDTVLKQEFSVYDHNRLPFVAWYAGEDFGADNIYHRGIGYIEEVEPLQDRVDALDLKLYKNISLLSNRQRFVSAGSGLNVNSMDNTAGRTFKVNGDVSKAVYYDAPPQMNASVYNYRDNTELLFQTVSGITDVTQGRRPTGITAGRAIESLKESAETRLADLLDTLADTHTDVGDLGLQIILQFFDGERIIHTTDGDKDKDFVVIAEYPPELQPQPEVTLDAFGIPMTHPKTGEVLTSDEVPEVTAELEAQREVWKQENGVALVLEDVTYRWDVKATTDSALPSTPQERAQVAADLFRLGGIDREALLEAMDYPNRHKILNRLAKEATGKNAGQPEVDTTSGQLDQIMQMLQQMGLPQEMLDQVMQQVSGGQSQGLDYKPQMTM